jgi:hypothetical protein
MEDDKSNVIISGHGHFRPQVAQCFWEAERAMIRGRERIFMPRIRGPPVISDCTKLAPKLAVLDDDLVRPEVVQAIC